ncbi:MAG TPA: hypothetical protein VE990_17950 [Acidimicrobiales bacterium]|nr:hypothetical protein [Acidimicrobiales bacterium]
MIVPTVVLAVRAGLHPVGPWGDQAVIEVDTRLAAGLHQMVGPYSRFGWSHPGPVYFYLLAPLWRLFGSGQAALAAASVVLTGAFGLLAVALAGRLGGRTLARWAAALVAAQLAALGAATVALVWNPVAVVVPASAFLVACAGLSVGRWWMLAPAVAVGSFLVQTDLSTGLVVAAVAVVALASGTWAGRGAVAAGARPGGRRRAGPAMAAAVVVAGLAWAAPVAQQVSAASGNLGRVLGFFRSTSGRHPLASAASAVGDALWPPLRGHLLSGPRPAPSSRAEALVAVLVLLGLATAALGWRRGRPVGAALAGTSVVTLAAGVVSAVRAFGPLFGYLTEWMTAAEVTLALAVVVILIPDRLRLGGLAALIGAAAATVVLGTGALPTAPGGADVAGLWSALRPGLPSPGAAVQVEVASADRWPWAAGLVDELAAHRYRPAVASDWTFLFAGAYPPDRAPGTATLVVWHAGPGAAPGGRLVARAGPTWVYLSG